MLTRRYPPYNAVESTRPATYAKYLSRYGWRALVVCGEDSPSACGERYDPDLLPESLPHVVCRVPPGDLKPPERIVADAAGAIRGMLRLDPAAWRSAAADARDAALWVVDNLLPELNPYPFTKALMARLPKLIDAHGPDVIWATYPPWGPHTAAAWAARRFSIPWVADFRDTIELETIRALRTTCLQRRWSNAREMRVARTAAALATVSPALARAMGARLRRPVAVLPNGFDADQFPADRPKLDDIFRISYTGSIPFPQRDPRPLFAALDRLLSDGRMEKCRVSVDFYGCHAALIESLVADHACAACVHARPIVSRAECLSIQRRSQILLLLAHGREKGMYTAKVFEYLAARRPILSVPGDNDCVDALLAHTGAGRPCAGVEELCETLAEAYRGWSRTGEVPYQGRGDAIAAFSRERQTADLAALLARVVRAGDASAR